MVAGDTTASGTRSEEEEDVLGTGPGDAAMAPSAPGAQAPGEHPPEEAGEPTKWKFAVIFLCFYGFMSSIKPGEPFITPYLLSSEKNFTREQVSRVRSDLPQDDTNASWLAHV